MVDEILEVIINVAQYQPVTKPRHKGGRPLTHKNTTHKHTRENTLQLNIRLQVFIKTITLTNNNDYTIS